MTTPDIMKAALLGAQFSADFFESDEETTNATNSIMLEHDYAKEEWINDANSNRSISNLNDSSEAFINTTFSTEESLNNSGEILIEEGVGFNTSASAETMEQTHEDRGNYDETATLDQQGSLSQACSVYGGAQSGPHSPGYEEAERQAQILAADLELTARQASIAEEERRLQAARMEQHRQKMLEEELRLQQERKLREERRRQEEQRLQEQRRLQEERRLVEKRKVEEEERRLQMARIEQEQHRQAMIKEERRLQLARMEQEQLRQRSEAEKLELPDEKDQVLEYLASSDMISNRSQSQFEMEKRSWGCGWSSAGSSCHNGAACPLAVNYLGLNKFRPTKTCLPPTSSAGQKIVIMKKTADGELIRIQNSADIDKIHGTQIISRQVDAATSLYHSQYDQGPSFPPTRPPNSDQAMSDITNTRMMYRPPPNSVMVKVPQVSSGAAPATVGEDRGNLYQCAECNESFYNQKALNKHTRNLHQVYECSKCGVSTVGYYKMASHNKRFHEKLQTLMCRCGRNFSEKRGLTKHQNSCTFRTT